MRGYGKAMKQFNKSLNADIIFLKTLHAKKDKREFRMSLLEIQKKHGISRPTVYREMKKDTPGLYKMPNYNPPAYHITEKEISMVRELLLVPYHINDIIRKMKEKMSINYSWDRLNKVRKIIDERAKEDPEYMAQSRESEFGDAQLDAIEQIFGAEKMTPGTYRIIKTGNKELKLSYEAARDIELRLREDNPSEELSPHARRLKDHSRRRQQHKESLDRTLAESSRGDSRLSGNALKEVDKLLEKYEKNELYPVLKAIAQMPEEKLNRIVNEALKDKSNKLTEKNNETNSEETNKPDETGSEKTNNGEETGNEPGETN